MIGSKLATDASTMWLINPSIGIVLTNWTAFLTPIAIPIMNENISKLKLRNKKLTDWTNFVAILYQKKIQQSMIDIIDGRESSELKKIYNQYINERKEITDITKFKVEDLFGNVVSQDSISPQQITKLNNFLAKILWI